METTYALWVPVLSQDRKYDFWFFFFQAEDGIRDGRVTGVQTCALPIFGGRKESLPERGSEISQGARIAGLASDGEVRPLRVVARRLPQREPQGEPRRHHRARSCALRLPHQLPLQLGETARNPACDDGAAGLARETAQALLHPRRVGQDGEAWPLAAPRMGEAELLRHPALGTRSVRHRLASPNRRRGRGKHRRRLAGEGPLRETEWPGPGPRSKVAPCSHVHMVGR